MHLRLARRMAISGAALAAIAIVPVSQSGTPSAGSSTISLQRVPLAASIGPVSAPAGDAHVRLVGFNDVHGYIQPGAAGTLFGTAAGGARQFVRAIENLTAGQGGNTAIVGAGDQVGASPSQSAFFDDEPTLDILRDAGVDYTAVGNHEFDQGVTRLLRQQDGGCNGDGKACTFTYNDSGNISAAYQNSQAAGTYAGFGTANPADAPSQPYDTPGVTTGYLAANVVYNSGPSAGKPVFPAYGIKTFPNGAKVAFIGEVLSSTPTLVTPTGVASVNFLDEASTANALVPAIKAQGVNTIVLLIHQGGSQDGAASNTVDSCANLTGDILPIVNNLDPSIGVVVSGHTHQAYDCSIATPANGTKLVTSAAKYTQALTQIDLAINPTTDVLDQAAAKNTIVDTNALTYETAKSSSGALITDNCTAGLASTGDALYDHARTIQCAAEAQVAAQANRIVGSITATISNGGGTNTARGAEMPMGDVIGDAQLAAGGPTAVAALTNPGGVRNSLFDPSPNLGGAIPGGGTVQAGQVTYGDAFNVQPFGNVLELIQMTGAQIYNVLEEQFVGCDNGDPNFGTPSATPQLAYNKILQVSSTFGETIDTSKETPVNGICNAIVPGSVTIGGAVVANDASHTYNLVVNNFLVAGGDNFATFKSATVLNGSVENDADALASYLTSVSDTTYPPSRSLAPPAANRITFISSVPPGLPEVPLALVLPALAALLLGCGVLVARRRRAAVG